MFFSRSRLQLAGGLVLCGLLSGCGVALEASRPTPVDLTQITPGQDRLQVVGKLGAPIGTTKNGDQSCDVFSVYTRGPGAGGKAAIAAGEAVADVFTLGLTELVFTPVEAGTQNEKHNVTACYDSGMKLATLQEDGAAVPPAGTAVAQTPTKPTKASDAR
jgi:hypothetical protein